MPLQKTEKAYYPTGQLRWEGTFINGRPEGANRKWYPNGILSDEVFFKNGRFHGVAKHWNKNGDLVGTYEMHEGTGVVKSWYDNDVLSGEISFVNGEMTGRQRCWFEDGELVTTVFRIRGRQVSGKKYREACESDSSLPRYDNEIKIVSWETKMKRLQKRKPETSTQFNETKLDSKLEVYLQDSTKQKARDWLTTDQDRKIRTLGEIPSTEESLALVNEAYEEKIEELFVIEVHRDENGENTGLLLAKLPMDKKKRKRALAWCNLQNEFQGFDSENDEGQEWMVVQLN